MGQQDNTAPDSRFEVVTDRRPAASAVKFYRIRDLERYQHYRDRNPPWVKLYGSQLEDYEFQQLPDATRFHFLALTWLASKSGNKIPNDPQWLANKIGAHEPIDLSLLFSSGLLEVWRPRPQESYDPGEQLPLPVAPAPADSNPSNQEASGGASNLLATCYQDASKLLAQRQRQRTETETHTETDTAPASAARTCGCCNASVCSEFKFSEALLLVERWKREGRRVGGRLIENPGGLARKLHVEGTADAEIRLLLRPPPRRQFAEEPCPTCFGTRVQSVEGKGARDCPDCVDETGRRTGKKALDSGAAVRPPRGGLSRDGPNG